MLEVHEAALAQDATLPAVDYPAVVKELADHGVAGLASRNGLSSDENRELMGAASVDAALYLIMKGLVRRDGAPAAGG